MKQDILEFLGSADRFDHTFKWESFVPRIQSIEGLPAKTLNTSPTNRERKYTIRLLSSGSSIEMCESNTRFNRVNVDEL